MEGLDTILSPAAAAGLAEFCRLNRVASLRFFGSVLRPDFSDASDVDILIDFEPGVNPDLLDLGGMQQDLSELLGREVDLKTPDMFSPAALRRVLATSLPKYAA